MSETGKFIGPLTEGTLKQAGKDFGIHYGSDIANEIARERTGREMAQLALKEANERLEDSKVDKMTGFLRRDVFIEQMQIGIDSLRRPWPKRINDPDSALVIMADIVGLHDINKAGGHPAGDRAIKAAASLLRDACRTEDGDFIGRIGGDEFAIFMPYDHEHINHEQMLNRVISRIEHLTGVSRIYTPQTPSLEYGIAIASPTYLQDAEKLLAEADPKRPEYSSPYLQTER